MSEWPSMAQHEVFIVSEPEIVILKLSVALILE